MGIPSSEKKSADIEPYSLRAAKLIALALRALLPLRCNARGAIGAIRPDELVPRCELA